VRVSPRSPVRGGRRWTPGGSRPGPSSAWCLLLPRYLLVWDLDGGPVPADRARAINDIRATPYPVAAMAVATTDRSTRAAACLPFPHTLMNYDS
jgi:hypothetical protein